MMGLTSTLFFRLVLVFIFFQVLARAESQKLDWISPSPQTVYGPGDSIKGEWTSSRSIVSPSVSLCSESSDDDDKGGDDCGDAVRPSVKEDGDQYSFSM